MCIYIYVLGISGSTLVLPVLDLTFLNGGLNPGAPPPPPPFGGRGETLISQLKLALTAS